MDWRERSPAAPNHENLALQQRRSRLMRRMRPRTPARTGADPLILGWDALEHVARIRTGVGARSHVLDDLRELEEIIRAS
jgi:hypothetical protein